MGCRGEEILSGENVLNNNDISIIKYAGIGVAMENAVSDLKEAADEITLSNEQDGIAESLLKNIPNLSV